MIQSFPYQLCLHKHLVSQTLTHFLSFITIDQMYLSMKYIYTHIYIYDRSTFLQEDGAKPGQ